MWQMTLPLSQANSNEQKVHINTDNKEDINLKENSDIATCNNIEVYVDFQKLLKKRLHLIFCQFHIHYLSDKSLAVQLNK